MMDQANANSGDETRSMMDQANTSGGDIELGDQNDSPLIDRDRTPMEAIVGSTPMEKFTLSLASAAVTTSVIALVLEPATIVFFSGLLTSLLGPYAWYQQTKLTDIKALQELHNAMNNEKEILQMENNRLKSSVEELTGTTDRLEDVEEALQVLNAMQGESVEEFANQVETNRGILRKMQKNLKANVLQNLLSVVIRSDVDGDMQIDESEISDMVERLESVNGVHIHEDRFRQVIKENGGSLRCVIDVVKNLLSENVDANNQIFVFDEDDTDEET